MRAARCTSFGGLETVEVLDIPEPEPGPGQAVVDVHAAAVNYPDLLMLEGRYQRKEEPPFTVGSEFAGVVRSVGEGVENVVPGDQVAGAVLVGAFAERIAVDTGMLIRVPDGVDLGEAAAFFVAHNTAWQALRSSAETREGEWVVVLGAAGGVGLAAVDVARHFGARVVACASSAEKLAVCRERGAEATIDYTTEDLKVRIREVTGGGADVVFDPVGGPYAEPALRALRYGGRFVVVGFAAGEIPKIPLNLVLLKGIDVRGYEMFGFMQNRREEFHRNQRDVLAALVAGDLRPHLHRRFPLEDVVDAMREVSERRAVGKVVVEPTH